ncbi:MAG: DEAD/DEAH box helicase [Myxococcales bacterium]|nr:DEAD/DEAH box helicase [Myxococcales bacterium]
MASFSELPLLPSLQGTLAALELTTLTDIQAEALPALLEGRALVGVAETGSGKTLTFVLPLLHQLKTLETAGSPVTEEGRPRGLVVVPGRELGEQVAKVFKSLTHDTRLRVRVALGGSPKKVARQNVAGVFDILVATPGRLRQLMETDALRLDDVRMLVLDEADQMLDPGFLPGATRVLQACPGHVQLVLFSATLPAALETVIEGLFRRVPIRVRTEGSHKVVPTLRTEHRRVPDGRRWEVLRPLLAEAPEAGTLLFVNTREQGDRLARDLASAGLSFACFGGELDPVERRRNLSRFRAGELRLLVVTDLAARGLDVERVERVVNVHLPREVETYLHRVGRTARAGRSGLVVNLVTERDRPLLEALEVSGDRR